MGLNSAMTTALTGLQAAETSIDVVGNNVANSSTVGFKESTAVFATQFLQTQSIGSAPSATRGGTNPQQTGLGVSVAAINPNFTQGTIQISSNPLDVAIQGEGFLIVQGANGETLYTRNGQLQTNADNEIVTTTGNRVIGYGVDDDFSIVESETTLTIPLGETTVAQATENVFMSGVLQPQAEIGDTPRIVTSESLGDVTLPFPDDPTFDLDNFDIVSAPSVADVVPTNLGAGTVPAGDYEYRIAFYVETGPLANLTTYEGAPSVTFGAISFASDSDVRLDDLPTDSSGDWTGRRLYRREGTGDFDLIAELDTTSLSFDDTVAAPIGGVLNDDAVDQATYSYYVTYYNTSNGDESRPTPRIGSLAVSETGRRIRVDDLPEPDGLNFDAVRIYRNIENGPGEFHLVATLEDGQTTFIDNVPDEDIEGNAEVDLIGPKANAASKLVDVVVRDGETYSTPFVEGTLSFTGQKGSRELDTQQMTITADTTVQDLITFMDQALGIDNPTDLPDDPAFQVTPGGVINSGGQIEFTSNMGIENALGISLSAFTMTPTASTNTQSVQIGFTETQAANGKGSTTDFVVFDSLGVPVNIRLTTVKEAQDGSSTTYRWYATSEDNEVSATSIDTVLGNGTITFDGNGNVVGDSTAELAVARNLSASQSPLQFEIDFSGVTGLNETNNLGEASSSLNVRRQDGFPPGSLSSFIITESGLIRGVYSNGTERPLGQLRMARFANPAGLQQVGSNMFIAGVNSGEPIDGNPGDRGIGSLTAGAVELSNTDIGQNLIELILASTQYRGGARVITAAQQLLDELLALRR